MGKVKDYEIAIMPIIEELRSRGLTDNHILQVFQLVLEGHPEKINIPKNEDKLIASINLDIYEDKDDVTIEGNTNAILHGSAALAIAYKHYHELSFGETISEVITEMEAIAEAGATIAEEDEPCQDSTHY